MSKELTISENKGELSTQGIFNNPTSFEQAQRIAGALIKSNLIPTDYQENMPNALIALEMANRIGASPIAVMQNLHIIEGRPSWSSNFIISAMNSSGKFSPLRFEIKKLGEKEVSFDYWEGPKGQRTKKTGKMKIEDMSCIAWAIEKSTGERLDGPEVTVSMAVAEGWYGKPGSKWKTMPELMIRYRAAAFFGRLYSPEILMGMHTEDEVIDADAMAITPVVVIPEEISADEKPKTKPRKKKQEVSEVEADAISDVDEASENTQSVSNKNVPDIKQPTKADDSEDDGFENFGE